MSKRLTAVVLAALLAMAVATAIALRRNAPATTSPRDRASTPPAVGGRNAAPALEARTQTAIEQFRSEVAAASRDQWSVLTVPALSPRTLGLWDDFRVGSPIVMKETGTSQYQMWYIGCRLEGASHDCGVGHATSADGLTWTRRDEPVFVAPDAQATHWVSALAIVKRGGVYSMWYSLDGDIVAGKTRGTLHLATSGDGISWQNVGMVHTSGNDRTRSIKHAVLDDGRLLHLWYFDRPEGGGDELLVHLTSMDGKAWTEAGGDSFNGRVGSLGRPWVTTDGRGGFRILLVDYREGAALRWLASADGTSWTTRDVERVPVSADGNTILAVTALQTTDGLWLWTTTAASGRRTAETIGLAFKKGSGS